MNEISLKLRNIQIERGAANHPGQIAKWDNLAVLSFRKRLQACVKANADISNNYWIKGQQITLFFFRFPSHLIVLSVQPLL